MKLDKDDDLNQLRDLIFGTDATDYTSMAQTVTHSGGLSLTESDLNNFIQSQGSYPPYYTSGYVGNATVDEGSTRVSIPLTDGSKLVYEKSSGDYFISEKVDHLSTSKTGKEPLRGNMKDPLVKTLFEKLEGSDFGDLPHLLDPMELKIRTEVTQMSYFQADKLIKDIQKWRRKAQTAIKKATKPITEEIKALKAKVAESVITINILSEHLGNLTKEAKYVKKVTLKQANDELDLMLKLNKRINNAL